MFLSMALEPGVDQAMVTAMKDVWTQGQTAFLQSVTNSTAVRRVVASAGYDIPQEIVAAVLAVVNELHGKKDAGISTLDIGGTCPV